MSKNIHFLVSEAPVPRGNKILGNVLVCLKENCPGFQQTPLDIMSGISLGRYPFGCPNSKVLTLPQLSLIIVGAPVTII